MTTGGRGASVAIGALLLLLAAVAFGASTMIHSWLSSVLVVGAALLLGAGVAIITLPAPVRRRRDSRSR
jgi:hypothetical protein